ncbi:MAG TPA: hypothetical protein VIW67_07315 [Terriglobales bacterium]
MSQAEKIREYVSKSFIAPARAAGAAQVVVEARHVHKDLRLERRFPAVCSAIDAKAFQDDCRLTLSSRSGPRQGSIVTWTFDLL